MAIVRAVKSGNWSDTTVWNTGALPTSVDDVYSNTFTVTIDISPTVLSISNATATGVTAGGSFVPSNGITLTATGAGVVSGTATTGCFNSSLPTGQSCTIVGNCTAGTANNSNGASNSSTGTLNIIGNCTGGANATSSGGFNASTGTLNITGNCVGGSGASGTASGAYNLSAGTLNITGNCIGGTVGPGAYNQASGTLNITGNCTGGTTNFTSYGAVNASTGTLSHAGTVQASATTAGIGLGAVGQVTILTGPLLSTDAASAGATASGVNPCIALRWFPADTALSTFEYRMRGASLSGSPSIRPARQLFLTDAYSATYPAAANVRSGTTYGPGNINTGTLAVPPAGSVALGVPVDATTGTAALTAANIRAAVGLASANLDTQLAAIPTTAAPSAASVASAVWSAVTRTITGGTVDTAGNAPSATTIATAVWAAASRTLTAAIDQSSTIAAAVWSATARTITGGTVDTLVNAPSVPSAATIASAVWAAADKTGYSLTSAERQAIATAVEQSILNENDGQAILNAIVGAIGNQNVDQVALVAAIRADLERQGGTLATRSTLTAAQVRTELAPELANLDATVSSRSTYAGSDTAGTATLLSRLTSARAGNLDNLSAAPPTAAAIATAVWSATTRTLTTAIDNSSTIAAAVWSAVSRTLTDNPGPSAADNATAVRQELGTELGRIDATISSRLSPSGTLARVALVDTTTTLSQAPTVPTPQQIASATRQELTPELSRMNNVATTQEVGDIVEGALNN